MAAIIRLAIRLRGLRPAATAVVCCRAVASDAHRRRSIRGWQRRGELAALTEGLQAPTLATVGYQLLAADELARFGLTDREREVLALPAAGRSNPEIACALFISAKTASVHVSNIIANLGVSRRGEAAAVAHRLGVAGQASP